MMNRDERLLILKNAGGLPNWDELKERHRKALKTILTAIREYRFVADALTIMGFQSGNKYLMEHSRLMHNTARDEYEKWQAISNDFDVMEWQIKNSEN